MTSCPHGGYAPAVGSLLGLARVLATSQKRDPFEDMKVLIVKVSTNVLLKSLFLANAVIQL